MNYSGRVREWLETADGRAESSSWELEGIRRSLRKTLAWLADGHTLYETPTTEYLCVMKPDGHAEVVRGAERMGFLPLGLQLGRAGIRLNPGEGFLLDPTLVAFLLEEKVRVREMLDPIHDRGPRSLTPPGAGRPDSSCLISAPRIHPV